MKNIILFLLILLKVPNQISSEIKIQFKRKWINDFSNEKKIINNLMINDLITKIKIGTPPQEINLSLHFKDFITYILGNECITECPKFNEKNSKTHLIIKKNIIYSYSGFEEGSISNETINIGDNNINNFQFILANKLRQDNFFSTTEYGVIGLNEKLQRANLDLEEINFIKQLKNQNLIDSYTFSIKYINENDGELIIGNYPHEYDKIFKEENIIEIYSHKISDNGEWGIMFDNITSGDFEIDKIEKSYSSLIYLENGVFFSNKEYQNIINQQFFLKYLNSKNCIIQEFLDYQIYICDNTINKKAFPSLKFHLKAIHFIFEFNFNDLFYEYNHKNYFLVFFTNSSFWKIGKQMFKKYRLSFNQDKRTISFYGNDTKNNNHYFLKFIFLLILGVIIIILLINLRNKKLIKLFKNKRIKAEELLEDEINL